MSLFDVAIERLKSCSDTEFQEIAENMGYSLRGKVAPKRKLTVSTFKNEQVSVRFASCTAQNVFSDKKIVLPEAA